MKKIILTLALLTVLRTTVFAGGGRIEIYTMDNLNGYYSVNSDTYVLAQVFVPDSGNTIASIGERAEFRIENPRDGDSCVNEIEQTTELGLLRARCRTTQPGTITVYVYSFADNYESSRYLLHFYAQSEVTAATQIPTSVSKTQPTKIPTHSFVKPTLVSSVVLVPEVTENSDQVSSELFTTTAQIESTVAAEKRTTDQSLNNDRKGSESSRVILTLALAMFGTIVFGIVIILIKTSKIAR